MPQRKKKKETDNQCTRSIVQCGIFLCDTSVSVYMCCDRLQALCTLEEVASSWVLLRACIMHTNLSSCQLPAVSSVSQQLLVAVRFNSLIFSPLESLLQGCSQILGISRISGMLRSVVQCNQHIHAEPEQGWSWDPACATGNDVIDNKQQW